MAAPKATPAQPQPKKIIADQEYLDINPDLVEAGVVVGDEVEIPAEQPKAPPAAAPKADKGKSAPDKKMFGNKDKGQEHPFDKTWAKGVVVRQADVTKTGDGPDDYAEINSSIRLAVYEPEVYERLEADRSFGTTKVDIIHDPR